MKIKISFVLIGLVLISTLSVPLTGLANTRTGTISGSVTYDGVHDTNHEVLVAAHPSLGPETAGSVHIQGPGNYAIDGLPDGDYYISAFLDIHDTHSGPPYSGEPMGWYDSDNDGNPDPVTVSGNNLSGINILMKDIESDYIQGTGCYLGGIFSPGGRLEVGLQTTIGQEPVAHQFISLPCEEFVFSNLPTGNYYLYLFYDLNGSGNAPEEGEPFGYFDANGDGNPDLIAFTEGDTITGKDITLGGTVHRVDFSATGGGNGSSWEDAFTDLQDALAIAQPGEEIWVASGIYTPGSNRSDTFELKQDVALYGGFNGTESYRGQRNWRANTTVLSGEIGDPQSATDNIYHVISSSGTIDEETILDGFTISGGYASEAAGGKGGGLNNSTGFPTLVNLNFVGNYALDSGAAIATNGNTQPLTIINCTFSGNDSGANGAIFNYQGKISVFNSSLVRNSGSNGGGIVTVGKYSNPPDPSAVTTKVHNTILWDNPGGSLDIQVVPDTTYATLEVSYSLVQGGFAGGTGIVTDDPLLVDPDGADNQYGTWDDNLHLQVTSPVKDAGDNSLIPADTADSDGDGNVTESISMDYEQDARINNTTVDIGADEYGAPQAISGLQIAASQPAWSGQTVIFAARAQGGTSASYTWDFGDGNVGAGPVLTHVYTTPGVYHVTLTAENSLGNQTTSMEIEVSQALTLQPGTNQTTGDSILDIELPGTAAGDVDIIYTPQSGPTGSPGSLTFAGISFQLSAMDAESNPIITPSVAFILTLSYDENTLPAGILEEELQVYRYDSDLEDWVPLVVLSRNLDEDQLTVELDHFSEFGLFAPSPPSINLYLPMIFR